ncbi:DMT family transporter [Marinomonas sp. 2405UD68-3]|uniref:DMT family transporter n=1 Tax=Marinomonas sp. 2405UD68-3 TaxID=3391835 RepID=UPI0039C93559
MNRTRLIGLAAGLGVTLTWASWSIATKVGLKADMEVLDLMALRLLVGGLLVAPFLIYFNAWKGLSWKQYLILGFFGGVPHSLLAYGGLERTSITHFSVFVYGMAPVMTALVGYVLLSKKINKNQLIGASFIILGIAAIGYEDIMKGLNMTAWTGNMMALGGITSFVVYMIFADKWKITVTQSLMACTFLNGLVFVPYWWAFTDTSLWQLSANDLIFHGTFQGIVPGVLAIFMTAVATRNIGADLASLFFALIPIVASLFAVLLLGEVMTLAIVAGLFFAAIGVLICSVKFDFLPDSKRTAERLIS